MGKGDYHRVAGFLAAAAEILTGSFDIRQRQVPDRPAGRTAMLPAGS